MRKINLTDNEIDFITRVFRDAMVTHDFCRTEAKYMDSIKKKLDIKLGVK